MPAWPKNGLMTSVNTLWVEWQQPFPLTTVQQSWSTGSHWMVAKGTKQRKQLLNSWATEVPQGLHWETERRSGGCCNHCCGSNWSLTKYKSQMRMQKSASCGWWERCHQCGNISCPTSPKIVKLPPLPKLNPDSSELIMCCKRTQNSCACFAVCSNSDAFAGVMLPGMCLFFCGFSSFSLQGVNSRWLVNWSKPKLYWQKCL